MPFGVLVAFIASGLPTVDVEDMLRRPRTPATLASLVVRPQDPRVLAVWEEGLLDPQPAVRAVAARMANVAQMRRSLTRIVEALARETWELAAVEQVRAVAALGSQEQLEALPATAGRFSRPVQTVAALALARRLGPSAFTSLPGFTSLYGGDERELVAILVAGRSENAMALAEIEDVRHRPRLLAESLAACRTHAATAPWPTVVAALADAHHEVRQAALWHLTFIAPQTLPADVKEAIDKSPEGRGQGPDPEATFVFELLARHLGRPPTDAVTALASLGKDRRPGPPLDARSDGAHLAGLLTPAETKTLMTALFGKEWNGKDAAAFLKKRNQSRVFTPSDGQLHGAMSLDPLGVIIAADAVRLFGCVVDEASPAYGALMTFRPDARPVKTSLVGMEDGGQPCARAAFVPLLATIAPPDHADFEAKEPLLMFLPLVPDFLSCDVRNPLGPPPERVEEVDEDDPRVGRGRIKAPKKLRDVRPNYPESAKKNRIQGIVTVEAVVAPAGCVSSLKILSSPYYALAWSAMHAVAGWRYAPILILGEPVPFVMDVTVNYRLN